MSEAKGQQHEPSMEEILASIRRIIAEDGEAPPPPAASPDAAAPAAPAPEEPDPDEVLELTDVVEPDGSVVSLDAAIEPPPPVPAPEPPPPPAVHREPPPPPAPAPSAPAEAAILSPAAAAASVAALSQITQLSSREQPRDRDLAIGAGHLTLEALVREELRPILKDWLDQHLPGMVERLVKDEIARLVQNVRR